MIVSWNWLKDYVPLDMPREELERRLMVSGLNHEGTDSFADDWAIDLEVTSNRPDCLGHLGIAREICVLWGKELRIPPALPEENGPPVGDLVKVDIECADLCCRYTARLIQGVKVGPSPDWMADRLQTVGLLPVNNVVDISNYVLMECGQPLHTFDFARLAGGRIIVRRPKPKETIEAIDHKEYELGGDMCVIADAKKAVAIGGVMGGASTEISSATRDVLIEAAEFDPVSIRTTARALNLHSDSSYRFERRVDPETIDWASRRCAELTLELAGGRLCEGVIDVGPARPARKPIVLRLAQLERILGITIPVEEVRRILAALGNAEARADASTVEVVPPTWRRDLTREIDLVEEVGRIHGYDKIPEDVSVPMAASARTQEDRVLDRIRRALTACGVDEAYTVSLVDEATARTFSPWTDAEPLASETPILRGADRLRLSLVPSLLTARRTNEKLGNEAVALFEIAKVYLPKGDDLPDERKMLTITSGAGFAVVKGIIESLLGELHVAAELDARPFSHRLLDPAKGCALFLGESPLGFLGELSPEGLKEFELRSAATVAEVDIAPLLDAAVLIPKHQPLSPYPAVSRDLNLVVDESVTWASIASTVRATAGAPLESLEYQDTYRDPERLGRGKKSLLLSFSLRSDTGTFTSQEADDIRDAIVAACTKNHGAELRA